MVAPQDAVAAAPPWPAATAKLQTLPVAVRVGAGGGVARPLRPPSPSPAGGGGGGVQGREERN